MSSFDTVENIDTVRKTPNTPSPSSVQFEESKASYHIGLRNAVDEKTSTGFIGFLQRKGVVKSEKQAVIIFLVLSGLLILASLFIFKSKTIPTVTVDPILLIP